MQAPARFPAKTTHPRCHKERLILVGASVRSAAQSARQAGFYVIGVDSFGDTDTREACHQYQPLTGLGDLATLGESIPASNLMQVGGIGDAIRIVETLAKRHTVLGPSAVLSRQLADPALLADLAQRSGFRFPLTFTSPAGRAGTARRTGIHRSSPGPSSEYQRGLGLAGAGPMLRKAVGQSGGIGVRWSGRDRVPDGNQDWAGDEHGAGEKPHSQPRPQDQLQQWVPGRSYGASFLSDGLSTCLLGVCRSSFTRKGAMPFVYAGSLGPVCLPPKAVRSLGRLGRRVMKLGMRGLFNVDLIVDSAGAGWLLEINPRWSGSSELIERSLADRGLLDGGTSLLGLAHLSMEGRPGSLECWICETERTLAQSPPPRTHLKRIVYSRAKMRLDRKRLDQEISKLAGDRLAICLCDVPRDGSEIRGSEPILSLIVSFDTGASTGMPQRGRWLREHTAAVQRSC